MKRLVIIIVAAVCALWAYDGCAQEIAALRRQLATGRDAVRVTETEDAAAAIRAVEQRAKRTKVNGYTIVILFDNSQQARENAVEAKETFEENFKGIDIDVTYENPWFTVSVGRYLTMEEAIIELGRIRSVFPKAFPRNAEMDIADFVIDEEAAAAAAAAAEQSSSQAAAATAEETPAER